MSPLVQRIPLSRAALRSKPPTSNGSSTVVVYETRNRRFVAHRALTGSEIWFNPPHTAYLVDIGIHSTIMQLKLPSRVEAFAFDTEVSVAWQVTTPLEAIDSSLEDGETVVRPLLVERLRELCRKHGVEDSAGAERAINEAFGRRAFNLPQGLTVIWCLASVSLHKDAQAHNASETRAEWTDEERELKHRSYVKHVRLSQVEAVEKEGLNTLLDKHRIERETRDKQHEIAIKELEVAFATARIDEGLIGLLRTHLAVHPEDTGTLITIMMKEELSVFEKERALWEIAVNHGLASPAQFSGPLTKLAAGIVAHVVPDPNGVLGEAVLDKLDHRHPNTVEGEVVEESEKVGDSDTEDDEDDNPV